MINQHVNGKSLEESRDFMMGRLLGVFLRTGKVGAVELKVGGWI